MNEIRIGVSGEAECWSMGLLGWWIGAGVVRGVERLKLTHGGLEQGGWEITYIRV